MRFPSVLTGGTASSTASSSRRRRRDESMERQQEQDRNEQLLLERSTRSLDVLTQSISNWTTGEEACQIQRRIDALEDQA